MLITTWQCPLSLQIMWYQHLLINEKKTFRIQIWIGFWAGDSSHPSFPMIKLGTVVSTDNMPVFHLKLENIILEAWNKTDGQISEFPSM